MVLPIKAEMPEVAGEAVLLDITAEHALGAVYACVQDKRAEVNGGLQGPGAHHPQGPPKCGGQSVSILKNAPEVIFMSSQGREAAWASPVGRILEFMIRHTSTFYASEEKTR